VTVVQKERHGRCIQVYLGQECAYVGYVPGVYLECQGGRVVDVSGMPQIHRGTDFSIPHGHMLHDASPCAPPYRCMADTEYKQEAQL
jgi:hypothetical protein